MDPILTLSRTLFIIIIRWPIMIEIQKMSVKVFHSKPHCFEVRRSTLNYLVDFYIAKLLSKYTMHRNKRRSINTIWTSIFMWRTSFTSIFNFNFQYLIVNKWKIAEKTSHSIHRGAHFADLGNIEICAQKYNTLSCCSILSMCTYS